MINRDNEQIPTSLKGYFLISESNMGDPNFYQSVVLMIEHNSDGAFGLIVNRKSDITLAEILPRFENNRGRSTPIYVGGPVQQEYLFVIHSNLVDIPHSSTLLEPTAGVFFEPSFRSIEQFYNDYFWESIPEKERPTIHLFLGYSGWAPGQLEREMEHGAWMIHPASPKIVFHKNPEQGWRDALREKGGIYKIFADSNQNPSLN